MAIREIALGTARKPHHRDFNRSTAALAQLYTAYLPAFDSAGIVKIFIGVRDLPGAIDLSSCSFGPGQQLLNVAMLEAPLDLAWYMGLPDLEKARVQLELLHAACLAVCVAQQWEMQPFHAAYAECQRANLANAWVLHVGKRFITSPTREFTACLVCQWTVRAFLVDLVIIPKDAAEAQVTTLLENDASNAVSFQALRWVNDRTVKVTTASPLQEWQVEWEG